MHILPQQNPNLVDTTIFENKSNGKSKYVTRKYGGTLNFGYVGPWQTSKTIAVYLALNGTLGIKNIKICLSNIGSLQFSENKFHYGILDYFDENYTPTYLFSGVNSSLNKQSIHNVNVENKNALTSKYVYLNLFAFQNIILQNNIIRYTWFFDYA